MMKLVIDCRQLAALVLLVSVGAFAQNPAVKPETKADAPTEAKEKLPSAREILDKSIEQMGGREAFRKHSSQTAKGTFLIAAQNIEGKVEVYGAKPNKLLMKIQIPAIGAVNTGYDGKVGWQSNPVTGPMLLTDKTLEQVASQADFFAPLHESEKYKTMETVSREKFEGEECYKVHLIEKSGIDSMEYFSVKTGLQTGSVSTQESQFGRATISTSVGEYKKVSDILLPSKITQRISGLEQTITLSEISFDDVDPALFELPKEIKALAEGKKAPAPDAKVEEKK